MNACLIETFNPDSYKSILHKTVDTRLRVLFVDITVYKASWSPYIGEELPIQHEVNNIHDDFAVAALKNSSTVGHVPWEISRVCWYFPHKSGSEITCSHKLTKDSLYSMHLRRN